MDEALETSRIQEISCHPALQANAQSLNPRMALCQALGLEMVGGSSFTLALVPFLLEYLPLSTTGVVELQYLQLLGHNNTKRRGSCPKC